AEAGVGAEVVDYVPQHSLLVLEFIEGHTQSAEDLRRGDKLEMVAAACRQLHSAAPFRDDCNMFRIQHRYLELVQARGFRLPDRYLEFEPQVRRIEAAMAVRDEGSVPCNNDLLAENFIDTGGAFRLIDYEYLGMNDACFELGNVWSESNLSLDQLDELVTHYYGGRLRNRIARSAVGPDVEVRLDALGLDPGRRLRHRLRLLVVGDGEVRARRRRVRRARLRPTARRGRPGGLARADVALAVDRDREAHGGAAAGRRLDREGAAGDADALDGRVEAEVEPHSQPAGGPLDPARVEADPVVAQRADDGGALLAQVELEPVRAGVLADVRDQLADGAVGEDLDLGRVAAQRDLDAALEIALGCDLVGEVGDGRAEALRVQQRRPQLEAHPAHAVDRL